MVKAYTAAIIMDNKFRFLCLDHVKMGNIVFPGGKVEDGERIYDNLVRECREEIGIEVTDATLFNTYVHDVTQKGYEAEWAGFFYEIKKYNGEPKIMEPDKHKGLIWMLPTEFLRQNNPKYPEYKAMSDFLEGKI